ncbi:aminoglycoside phosphotransferase family protein [Paenibacillus sp. OAS669]|uniref:aminoglycoside phosphotransferase family protein n=1 Tax=Paenibacillus sp. OAS669 TaxID=2663821 RepID=UPI0017890EC2|nr:aminoglycoside phosphotransferase family protein [Paenibacillus sp. OAS669]MBE1442602.1 aminoglycoside phosphotransferase (APT) family kinase protein [Paenibacillus sp. OAS669]
MNVVQDIIEEQDLAITHVEELNVGFSTAKKYILFTKDDEAQYLLKIYGIEKTERRKNQFDLMNQHFNNHVSCPKPVQFGVNDKHQVCYMILSYLKGGSGDKTISHQSVEEQYSLGVLAGKELRKIHFITPPQPFDWYQKRTLKYQKKMDECKRLGLTFYKQAFIENYIHDHLHFIKDSLVTFQHDDFHPQNMIVKENGAISIIDFDSYDWGDPFEEFFKIPKYTIYTSLYFAKGQIEGYFEGNIPDTFWRKYNLFVALNQHASLLGGVHSNNLAYVQERTRSIIETHDFNNNGAPDWFTNLPKGTIFS